MSGKLGGELIARRGGHFAVCNLNRGSLHDFVFERFIVEYRMVVP